MSGTASKLSAGQFAEFSAAVVRQLPREMDTAVVQALIQDQGVLQKLLHGVFGSLGQKQPKMGKHTAAIFEQAKVGIKANLLREGQGEEEAEAMAEGTMDYIAALCSGYTIDSPTYTVEMDDRYPLSHWLKQGGYVLEHPDLTDEMFPLQRPDGTEPGPRTVGIEVPRFNWGISGDGVFEQLRERGCRPATPHETLAFGVHFAAVVIEKVRWPIISFGYRAECSHCKGGVLLDICKRKEGGIGARIVDDNVGYFGYCHFAAVKVQQN